MHRRFVEVFNTADLPALLALYEFNATFVPQPGHSASGIEAMRGALQQYLALNGRLKMETTYVVESGESRCSAASGCSEALAPDGKAVEMCGNSIEILRRQSDGSWRFVIDHPLGAE